MGVVTYTCIEGEIISETRDGVERDYLPDPLGSTVALLDSNQNKTDAYSYWPYGEDRTSTGSSPTPYRFVGTLGYRRETSTRSYVRARHYRSDQARWMKRDPLWPGENPYGYVNGSPASWPDSTGLSDVLEPPSVHPFPPPWLFPPKTCRVPPVIRPAPVPIAPGQVFIIICGIEAGIELCYYEPYKPKGPFTWLGDKIGQGLFPDPVGDSDPQRRNSPRRPKRRTPKQRCKEMQDRCNDVPEPPIGYSCWECYRRCLNNDGHWPHDRNCDFWNR